MRKLLISGGPVHAHLDAVKIVTNRFRGGLMAETASHFAKRFPCEVTYLTARGARLPENLPNLAVRYHEGFFDYQEQVLTLAPEHSDIVLGAAVANLVPVNPWKGKFPSHDYEEGDIVSVDFMVAPRIITKVRNVAPNANLFGFKLLSDVSPQTLVDAAYGIVLDAHATAVIANDARDLMTKLVVTREKAVHPFKMDGLFEDFLWDMMNDEYYRTHSGTPGCPPVEEGDALVAWARKLAASEPGLFPATPEGLMFGTVARRSGHGGFWTTGRGKQELSKAVWVSRVEHASRTVYTGEGKASLNAPLLDALFNRFPAVTSIVHGHVEDPGLPVLPYAPAGTTRDSLRQVSGSFNVAGHGCYRLYEGDRLKPGIA